MTAPAITPDPAVIELLTDLAQIGVRVAPDGANVRYWAPLPLAPELRDRIVALKGPLLLYLAIWSVKRASALQQQADDLVSELGVAGSDAVIQEHATRCVEAYRRQDMLAVRAACFAIESRVRRLATPSNATGTQPKASDPAR